MTTRQAKTFEDKINAILRYNDYTYSWDKAKFLLKFAYLADDELEKLLGLTHEIERYAWDVAGSLFSFGHVFTAEDAAKIGALEATVRERYPYLEHIRLGRLVASTAYYAVA